MSLLSKIILWLWGWQAVGKFPDIKKCVIIHAPHTSNMDFVIGRLYFYISGIKVKFLIKKEIFKFPLNFILRFLGAIPVDRQHIKRFPEKIVELFNKHKQFRIIITPEGTRKKVKEWKRGFYYIALKANVPIVLTSIDYKKKEMLIITTFYPTGDYEKDIVKIMAYYKNITARYPENFYLPD